MVEVSFIIPIYNVGEHLNRCITSVLEQKEKNIEIILVDDGSTDMSPEICEEYLKLDERITVVNKVNGGLSYARLAGFNMARGKYILFVDGDDYIEPDMTHKLVASAKENNSDVVLCGYYTNTLKEQTAYYLSLLKNTIIGKENIINNYIQPFIGTKKGGLNLPRFLCFKLLKRELIEVDYFKHENIYFSEDIVFNLLYTDGVKIISVVNEPLYHYRLNNNSLSNRYRPNKWQMYLNLFAFLKEYLSDRNIEVDEERLNDTIISAVFSSIDNLVLSGKYRIYMREISKMRNDLFVVKLFQKKHEYESFSIRVSLTLLRLRLYRTLYFIRRIRLNNIH